MIVTRLYFRNANILEIIESYGKCCCLEKKCLENNVVMKEYYQTNIPGNYGNYRNILCP